MSIVDFFPIRACWCKSECTWAATSSESQRWRSLFGSRELPLFEGQSAIVNRYRDRLTTIRSDHFSRGCECAGCVKRRLQECRNTARGGLSQLSRVQGCCSLSSTLLTRESTPLTRKRSSARVCDCPKAGGTPAAC